MDLVFLRSSNLLFDSRSLRTLFAFSKEKLNVSFIAWNRNSEILPTDIYEVQGLYFEKPAIIGHGKKNWIKVLQFQFFILRNLIKLKPKIIYACDVDTSLTASLYGIFFGVPVIFDQYDAYSTKIPSNLLKGIFDAIELKIAKHAKLFIVASVDRAKLFGRLSPIVIENCPSFRVDRAIFKGEYQNLFFGGLFLKGRMILELLELPTIDKNVMLSFVGYGPLSKQIEIKSLETERINIHGAMSNPELVKVLSKASVSIAAYDPLDKNNKVGAVSKVYEAAIAGVPLIVSKGTTTAILVQQYGLGWSIDYGDLGSLLACVREKQLWTKTDYEAFWSRCDDFLSDRSTWDSNGRVLNIIKELCNRK